MRVLFIAGGSPATVFALAPLATAMRNAGHTTFVAANANMMDVVSSVGLPGVPIVEQPILHFITTGRDGQPIDIPTDPVEQARFTGRWFARMALASMPKLEELSQQWRPDVVIGGTMSYAAPLLARRLGVPFIRHAWDAIEADLIHPGAAEELREVGLDAIPSPDLFIDICPPSLLPPTPEAGQPMRFIPANTQRPVANWMLRRGGRPRVCVSSGSKITRSRNYDDSYAFLRELARTIASLDVDMWVAAPQEVALGIREDLGDVRAEWMALDVVLPVCDLLVHHGGGVTSLTALNAAVPQLILPRGAVLVPPARRIASLGAGAVLDAETADAAGIAEVCQKLLADSSYRERAHLIAGEIAAMPLPAEVVAVVEDLARANTDGRS